MFLKMYNSKFMKLELLPLEPHISIEVEVSYSQSSSSYQSLSATFFISTS
jgi:hypothetical protein